MEQQNIAKLAAAKKDSTFDPEIYITKQIIDRLTQKKRKYAPTPKAEVLSVPNDDGIDAIFLGIMITTEGKIFYISRKDLERMPRQTIPGISSTKHIYKTEELKLNALMKDEFGKAAQKSIPQQDNDEEDQQEQTCYYEPEEETEQPETSDVASPWTAYTQNYQCMSNDDVLLPADDTTGYIQANNNNNCTCYGQQQPKIPRTELQRQNTVILCTETD